MDKKIRMPFKIKLAYCAIILIFCLVLIWFGYNKYTEDTCFIKCLKENPCGAYYNPILTDLSNNDWKQHCCYDECVGG